MSFTHWLRECVPQRKLLKMARSRLMPRLLVAKSRQISFQSLEPRTLLASDLGDAQYTISGTVTENVGQRETWIQRYDNLNASLIAPNANPKAPTTTFDLSLESEVLAWSESYILSSYVSMYEATGQTQYLDEFRSRMNTILPTAKDRDHDGLKGWGDFDFSLNLLPNNGFEAPNSTNSLPTDWERWQSTSDTAGREQILNAHGDKEGQWVAVVKTNPAVGWQGLRASTFNAEVSDNNNYEPGVLYQLSFWGRTNGKVGGRVQVIDYTVKGDPAGHPGEPISLLDKDFFETEWIFKKANFTAPAASGHDLRVLLTNTDWETEGGIAYFDDIKIQQYAEYAVHGGMISTPMAQFAAKVLADPILMQQYGDDATTYINFIRNNILAKWDNYYTSIDAQRGVYIRVDDGSLHHPRKTLPHNQYLAMARTHLWLYQAEGNPIDAKRAQELGESWKSQLRPVAIEQNIATAYTWNYQDILRNRDIDSSNPLEIRTEDVSHANVDINFAVEAHRLGWVFDDVEMQRLINTFVFLVWNKSWTTSEPNDYVNGTKDTTKIWPLWGWSSLASAPGQNDTWSVVNSINEYRLDEYMADVSTTMLTSAHLVASLPAQGRVIENGSFETPTAADASLPDGWLRVGSTPTTAFRDNAAANRHSGSWGLIIRTEPGPSGQQVIEQPILDYIPGAATAVTFWGRTNGSAAGGHAEILDATTGDVLDDISFNNTEWQQFALKFTNPVQPGHAIRVRLGHQNWEVPNGAAYFDEIKASNHAPSFAKGAAKTATDESPIQSFTGWATRMLVGPLDDAGQKLRFVVTNNNNGLFSDQPAIDAMGTLTFTPLPNVHGTAIVTVKLLDDGGTANGGKDTSDAQTFNVTITKLHRLQNVAETGVRRGLDVTGSTSPVPDGFIASNDVLAVINYINAKGSGKIPDGGTYGPPYCDVNGDDYVVAEDVLKIINYINSGTIAGVEANTTSRLDASNLPNELMSLLVMDIAEQAVGRRRLR